MECPNCATLLQPRETDCPMCGTPVGTTAGSGRRPTTKLGEDDEELYTPPHGIWASGGARPPSARPSDGAPKLERPSFSATSTRPSASDPEARPSFPPPEPQASSFPSQARPTFVPPPEPPPFSAPGSTEVALPPDWRSAPPEAAPAAKVAEATESRPGRLVGVIVSFSEPEGVLHPIRKGRTTLGRGDDAQDVDVYVDDPKASRQHCIIAVQPDQIVLFDAASRHGTYIKKAHETVEEPVTTVALEDGDVFRIGDTRYQFYRFRPDVLEATRSPR